MKQGINLTSLQTRLDARACATFRLRQLARALDEATKREAPAHVLAKLMDGFGKVLTEYEQTER